MIILNMISRCRFFFQESQIVDDEERERDSHVLYFSPKYTMMKFSLYTKVSTTVQNLESTKYI